MRLSGKGPRSKVREQADSSPVLQLRPFGGGRERDADPRHVRPLSQDELLSALLSEVNACSQQSHGTK
ncbi:hypothetical protein GCM10023336_07560 [Streptomyces similanensis]|uniref:DUF397 domain-containing protein n=1 Tax=Streptomyces similanensis TaxID=1274988 RepID=A0ABP9JU75_9ACTN